MASIEDLSFSDICEVYLQEYRAGNKVNLRALAKKFPKFSERILTELPHMALLESSLKPERESTILDLFQSTNYEIQDEIGRGASGVVFRTRDKSTNRLVALKLMKLSRNPESALRLTREIESLSRLNHPNVVSIIDQGAIKDYVFIVMSLVDGCCMSELFNKNPTLLASYWVSDLKNDWSRLANWGREIAGALEYIHSQNIFHRDLKPANILINRDGNCFITDFGLAKIRSEGLGVSRSGMVVGTPRYMAPEQMRGVVDQRSDLYSLGRTLYEIACLGADASYNCHEQVDLAPICKINPNVPAELGQVIDKACDQVAERRFQNASELAAVFQRYLDGRTPCDRRRPGKRMSEREFKTVLRRRHRTVALISTGVFAFTFASVFAYRAYSNKPIAAAPPLSSSQKLVATESFKSLASKIQSNDTGFVEVVGEAIKQSVVHGSENETAKKIEDKIDKIVSHVTKEGLKPGELDEIIQGYRKSALNSSDKILALLIPLNNSGLSHQEKIRGQQTLERFAKTVLSKKVTIEEADRMLAALFLGNIPKLEQMVEIKVPEQAFASWLVLVEQTFGNRFQSVDETPVLVHDELNQILDKFLQNKQ
ncbi:MAG: serine/threonine protein kinase [Pirellula sp.]|jgi:serine/threonine protein kinase|nr:serine/threonine protein kinase [Pirellula sp.]